MKTRISINWCFEDTDFEDFQYEEARLNSGLPSSLNLNIEKIEEEYSSIEEYLQETYNFEINSWEED